MERHVVVGSGPVGSALSRTLLARGAEVRVITRSGSGVEGADRVAADAADVERLIQLTRGAVAVYNCVNPPYHQWAQVWPGVAAALLRAASTHDAVLATTANLYGYGPVDRPMTEATPLTATGTKGRVRNAMWADVVAAHEAGRVRAFEVRGSDYLGGSSVLSMMAFPAWARGRRALLPTDLDQPHSFTDVRDVADLLAAGVGDRRAWGQAWHVPSADAPTVRAVVREAATQLGVPGKVLALPKSAVWAYGVADPFVRELRETQHQFRRPFLLDSSAAQETFELKPRPLTDSVAYDIQQNWPGTRPCEDGPAPVG